jgi:uncharacterized membrane protein YgdD (TMEM256/DUF423 family)
MFKPALISATLLGASAVIIGAFGAHYLKTIFTPAQLLSFETGVKYQFYHTLALAFTGILGTFIAPKFCKIATWLFTIGTIFFSGSIYILTLLASRDIIGIKGIGIITPIGGLLLVSAWLCLMVGIWRKEK